MRNLFILLLFVFCSLNTVAKSNQQTIGERIEALDKALLSKDTIKLNAILHNDVSYGHSNGWIEQKKEVTGDLYNGKLTYKEITAIAKPLIAIYDKTGIARLQLKVIVIVDGKEIVLKLHVLQTWILEKNEWKLVARQSVKVD